MLRGDVADPADLDSLRDLVGTITALVDLGGVAVVDPQMLSLFDPAEWRARFFESDEFLPRNHIAILASEDDAAFRPQAGSTRAACASSRGPTSASATCHPNTPATPASSQHRFADFQALGGIVEEGREIVIDGLPASMRAHHAGALNDSGFNNVHLAIRWPD